jgi:hypothetical protein
MAIAALRINRNPVDSAVLFNVLGRTLMRDSHALSHKMNYRSLLIGRAAPESSSVGRLKITNDGSAADAHASPGTADRFEYRRCR